jgi:hypothetical protein
LLNNLEHIFESLKEPLQTKHDVFQAHFTHKLFQITNLMNLTNLEKFQLKLTQIEDFYNHYPSKQVSQFSLKKFQLQELKNLM